MLRKNTKICEKCGTAYTAYDDGFNPKNNWGQSDISPNCLAKNTKSVLSDVFNIFKNK